MSKEYLTPKEGITYSLRDIIMSEDKDLQENTASPGENKDVKPQQPKPIQEKRHKAVRDYVKAEEYVDHEDPGGNAVSGEDKEAELRTIWYAGRSIKDIPLDERESIEAAIALGINPEASRINQVRNELAKTLNPIPEDGDRIVGEWREITMEEAPPEPEAIQRLREIFEEFGISAETTEAIISGFKDRERVQKIREKLIEIDAKSADEELDVLIEEYKEELEGLDPAIVKEALSKVWETNQEGDDVIPPDLPLNDEIETNEEIEELENSLPGDGDGGNGEEPPAPPADGDGEAEEPEESDDDNFIKLYAEWIKRGVKDQIALEFANKGIKPTDENLGLLEDKGEKELPTPESMAREAAARRGGIEDVLKQINDALDTIEDRNRFMRGSRMFLEPYVNQWGDDIFDEATGQTFAQRLNEIKSGTTDENVKDSTAAARELIIRLFSKHTEESREREELPKSMEDLAELLMKKLTAEYKPGGVRELMTPDENGELQVNYVNLGALMRKDAMFWANFSPDDPRVNLFGTPLLEMEYRQINLGAVLYEGKQYMRKRIKKTGLDPNTGRMVESYDYVEDEHHKEFRNKMMNLIFYYQLTRNWNIYHGQTKEDMGNLNKAMAEVLNTNGLTRSDGFETLFSVPGLSEGDLLAKDNGRVGELTALAEKTYKSIYNLEEMQRVLGKESPLFKIRYTKADSDGVLQYVKEGDRFVVGVDGKLKPETKDGEGGETTVRGLTTTWKKKWYDENGNLATKSIDEIDTDWVRGQFLDYINPFAEQNKNADVTDEIRERIRQSLLYRNLQTLKLPDGSFDPSKKLYSTLIPRVTELVNRELASGEIDKKYKFEKEYDPEEKKRLLINLEMEKEITQYAYEDARMAEEIAYTFGWMGIRGMGDTSITGFFADTKLYRTRDYRTGQSRDTSKGADIGNPLTIPIYEAMTVPLYAAVRTLDGDTIQRKADRIANNFLGEYEEITKKDERGEIIKDENGNPITEKAKQNPVEIAKKFKFRGDALKTYYGNHFARSVKEYDSVAGSSEWNLDKVIGWDPFKGTTVDRAGLYKMMDEELIKPGRYRVSGYGDTHYDEEFESFERVTNNSKVKVIGENGEEEEQEFRVIRPKTEPLGAFMFGKQVYEFKFMKEVTTIRNGETITEMVPDYTKANEDRSHFWQNPVLLRMAAEIKAHRNRSDMSAYWDNHKVRKFFQALSKLPADVSVDEENIMNTKARSTAFSHEQLEYVMRLAGVEEWKLDLYDTGVAVGGGIIGGLLSGLKKGLTGAFK